MSENIVNIYIDAEYLLQSLRRLKDKPRGVIISKYDFKWDIFIKEILKERDCENIYYYTAILDKQENEKTFNDQIKFLDNIKKLFSDYNYIERFGKMIKITHKGAATWDETINKRRSNKDYTWTQKGIDTKIIMDLCLNIYESKNNINIVISGDEDFAEVLEHIRKNNEIIELVSFDRFDSKLSDGLKNAVDKVVVYDYKKLAESNII